MTIRLRTFALVAASLLLVLVATRSEASTILFANLTNAQEPGNIVPTTNAGQPRPASFGTATFVLNDTQTALFFTATIFNIDVTGAQTLDTNDNLGNAHIHAGAAVAPGVNGPVVWGFFGSPFNDTTPNDSSVTPFATGVGGTFSGKWDAPEGNSTTLAAQLAFILSGRSYINFHSTQFPGGEIRGAIQVAAVPEPSPVALVAFGLVLMLGQQFRRR